MPTSTHTAVNGTGQVHIYSGGLNNTTDHTLNLDFSNITKFSHGHHARAGGGNDTFNFTNIHRVDSVIVGRLEDFNIASDTIAINGTPINLYNPPSNVRIVEFNGNHNDSNSAPQQWILIDTGQGHIFYSLSGARVDMTGNGMANSGNQEGHFIQSHQVPNFATLQDVNYIDPLDYVPEGLTPNGGIIIQDDDKNAADVLANIVGTGSGDLISGGLNDDKIYSGSGHDTAWGGSGHDSLYGGNDNDVLHGSIGNDRTHGGNGNDKLYGGNGNDRIDGASGADRMYGGNGNDKAYGGNDNDYGWGHDGNDIVKGGNGNDRVYGGNGNDKVYGDNNDDRVYGQNGNDSLYGGSGSDLLYGGNNNDLVRGSAGTDRAWGGAGADTFEFRTGDLMDWDQVSGNWDQKNAQLDVIEDFVLGTDQIEFDNYANVDDRGDLKCWKTTIEGNVHFTVQVRATNERVLVDVADNVEWADFFGSANFDDNFTII